MATRSVPCRVCGKMFVPCNKTSSALGAFNYHSVACSTECGAEYLRRVLAARQQNSEEFTDTATAVDEVKYEDDIKEEPKRTFGLKRKLNTIDE